MWLSLSVSRRERSAWICIIVLTSFPSPFRLFESAREDITPLADYFLDHFCQKYGLQKEFSSRVYQILNHYKWPGNIPRTAQPCRAHGGYERVIRGQKSTRFPQASFSWSLPPRNPARNASMRSISAFKWHSVCMADTAKKPPNTLVSPAGHCSTSSKNMACCKNCTRLRISERVQFGIYFAYRQQQIPHLFCRQTKLERI